jgi:DNA-binding phage protein
MECVEMSTKQTRSDPKFARAYDRGILRSAFVSLFWVVISHLKKKEGFTLKELAKRVGANKAEVSRWFNGDPNWTLSTVGAIASALNLDIKIVAIDRKTGEVFTPAGIQTTPHVSAVPQYIRHITPGNTVTESMVPDGPKIFSMGGIVTTSSRSSVAA